MITTTVNTDEIALFNGDCLDVLRELDDECVQVCVTSPPYYGLRDYGVAGQIGLEETPEDYVARLVEVFSEVRRVLKPDGTLWLNLGDTYARQGGSGKAGANAQVNATKNGNSRRNCVVPYGLKPKDLIGIPWRVAFALQADGWVLRQDIIWHKPNPMPAPVTDRCVSSHEYVFLLAKASHYYFDHEAIREDATRRPSGNGFRRDHRVSLGGRGDETRFEGVDRRNRRSVWSITNSGSGVKHFATFPPALVEPCVLAGSRPGDVVLDPFNGAGTTGLVARMHGRSYVGVELNPDYAALTVDRWRSEGLLAA